MSFFQTLQRFSCLNTGQSTNCEEVDVLIKDHLKYHTDRLPEEETLKLHKTLENINEFQQFILEITTKNCINTNDENMSNYSFHPNIIKTIFLLAKIGLLETSELFKEWLILNNVDCDTKNDLELEVIRETNNDNIDEHIPLEIILDDVRSKTEIKTKLDELSNDLQNINVKMYQFRELKKATNYFNEEKFEGISKPGRLIGPGRIGKVFLGVNLIENTELVVVKRVRQVDKYLDHFMRELNTVSKLNHPNIIKLLGYSIDELPCLVYEYTANGSLKRLLDNTNFVKNVYDAKDRVNTLLQVASAIQYLHNDEGMVHGDIKPENILLHKSTVKLCGFGLINTIVIKGITNRIAGTNFYVAPELGNDDYSWLSDVYALGVVVMQVLTGMKVFDSQRSELERYLPRHVERLMNSENHLQILTSVPTIISDPAREAYINLIRISLSCATIVKDLRPNITFIYENLQETYKLLKVIQNKEV